MRYVRDMRGYGANPPNPKWPGGANVAVQFVVNYEEGGESCILDGDPASECLLSEIVGAQPWKDQRNLNMESIYEYGARSGFWRLWRAFTRRNMPVTVYGGRYVDPEPHVGHYYPSLGHTPGYGRLEIEPPLNRKPPQRAESFHQSWSARSEPIPAQSDIPQTPPAVILAPDIGASRPGTGASGLPQDFPHRRPSPKPRP